MATEISNSRSEAGKFVISDHAGLAIFLCTTRGFCTCRNVWWIDTNQSVQRVIDIHCLTALVVGPNEQDPSVPRRTKRDEYSSAAVEMLRADALKDSFSVQAVTQRSATKRVQLVEEVLVRLLVFATKSSGLALCEGRLEYLDCHLGRRCSYPSTLPAAHLLQTLLEVVRVDGALVDQAEMELVQ
jgi:hypothetical protein